MDNVEEKPVIRSEVPFHGIDASSSHRKLLFNGCASAGFKFWQAVCGKLSTLHKCVGYESVMSFVAVEVLGRVTSLTAFGLKRNFIVVTEEDNDQKEALFISV